MSKDRLMGQTFRKNVKRLNDMLEKWTMCQKLQRYIG